MYYLFDFIQTEVSFKYTYIRLKIISQCFKNSIHYEEEHNC